MIVGRAVAGAMSPIALAYWRWVIVVALLAPFCWREALRQRAVLLRSWRILLLLGVMSTSLYNSLTYWALTYTTATNTTILNSMIPICVMFGSWVLLRETPSGRALRDSRSRLPASRASSPAGNPRRSSQRLRTLAT